MEDNLIAFPMENENDILEEDLRKPADEEPEKVLLLGLDLGHFDADRSIEELAALAEANGMQAVAEVIQKRNSMVASTVLGAGKLEEARLIAHNLGAVAAIFDGELTGSQIRNLEQRLGIAVIDRTLLILEIFSARATSHEGKTQTELAMLEYRLPRLAGLGTSLSRQGGGGGGGGGARRGGGETKLEYDRRYLHTRISLLKKRIVAMEAQREETRRSRAKTGAPLIAMVGYTNVGKSSLVNALTGSDIGTANMLFATLDPTARKLELPNGQTAVLIDTVGFVSRLPHHLVDAFKSTLEETAYADILITVCDASDPDAPDQLSVTDEVLHSLGAGETPKIIVYNKCDLVKDFFVAAPAGLMVSAHTGQGLEELKAEIARLLDERVRQIKILLPYDKLSLADNLRRHGVVHKEEFRENGVYYEAGIEATKVHLFEEYLFNGDN